MRTRVVALAALLLNAGKAYTQTTAVQDAGLCPTSSSTTGTCGLTAPDPTVVADLTPTQWLFGRDQARKLSRSLAGPVTESQARSNWALVLDRAAAGPVGGSSNASSGAASDRRRSLGPIATTAGDSSGRGVASRAAVDRFLIEEWRKTELDVADSVHHANLERIFARFDSAQHGHLSDPDRMRILVQLDRMNRSNETAWLMFKTEINRRANEQHGRVQTGGAQNAGKR